MPERKLHIPDSLRNVVEEPNWYDRLGRVRSTLLLGSIAASNVVEVATRIDSPKRRASELTLQVFEQLLTEGAVNLGSEGPDWDGERKPVDTVVIHHTGSGEPMRLSRLNAMHLLRLYVPKYQNPGEDAGEIGGKPIYSGHFDVDGNPVFYGYHWLVRQDGTFEHLISDEAIGWHAGNWEVNKRSVAVCFDDDLENSSPTDRALTSASELIADTYPEVEQMRIIGHNAVVQTICPGGQFGTWSKELRDLVQLRRSAK